MIIEKRKISELKPAPYNPRQSTKKQEEDLKKSLEKFWLVEPIVFNKRTGFIVWWHFRVRELAKLWHKEVDCVIVDLDEDSERELNIRLNWNAWEWDFDSLANYFEMEDLKEWWLDFDFLKDSEENIDFDNVKSNEDRDTNKKKQEITCPDCWKIFKI